MKKREPNFIALNAGRGGKVDGYRLEMKMFGVHNLPADPGVLFTREKATGPKSRRQELHEAVS